MKSSPRHVWLLEENAHNVLTSKEPWLLYFLQTSFKISERTDKMNEGGKKNRGYVLIRVPTHYKVHCMDIGSALFQNAP